MHIVRSDKNADTSIISLAALREELTSLSKVYDREVRAVEGVTVLLFNFEGAVPSDDHEIALVVGDLTFTIRERPYAGGIQSMPPVNLCKHEAGFVPNDAKGIWECELGCGATV